MTIMKNINEKEVQSVYMYITMLIDDPVNKYIEKEITKQLTTGAVKVIIGNLIKKYLNASTCEEIVVTNKYRKYRCYAIGTSSMSGTETDIYFVTVRINREYHHFTKCDVGYDVEINAVLSS